MPAPLRDRRRDQLRREVADQALALAQRDGWAHVTVAQVAEAAGISRRAFFTHFATKDDALVHGATDDLDFLAEALDAREEGTTFVEVLRSHADSWIDEMGAHGATRRARWAVEREHPEVAAKVATVRAEALRRLAAPAIAHDLGVADDDPLAHLAAAAFAGMGATIDVLFATDPTAAPEHVHSSIALLEALISRAARRG